MELTISWQKPIPLTKNKKIIVDEGDLPEALEPLSGVYFFARKFGSRYLPFYIGESLNLRNRLKSHLKSKRIADVLRGIASTDDEIRNGARSFHCGYFIAKSGQQAKACIQIVQRHLIRNAVEQGWPILNINLKKIRTHSLLFEGNRETVALYGRHSFVEQ